MSKVSSQTQKDSFPVRVRWGAGLDYHLTELFFRPEHIEARLWDDLAEELQQHVIPGGLQCCLVIDFYAGYVMHLVVTLIHVVATWQAEKKEKSPLRRHDGSGSIRRLLAWHNAGRAQKEHWSDTEGIFWFLKARLSSQICQYNCRGGYFIYIRLSFMHSPSNNLPNYYTNPKLPGIKINTEALPLCCLQVEDNTIVAWKHCQVAKFCLLYTANSPNCFPFSQEKLVVLLMSRCRWVCVTLH